MPRKPRDPDKPGDYEIGYGKPPKHSQIKKGERRNPSGRPKQVANAKDSWARHATRVLKLEVGGQSENLQWLEALQGRMFERGMKGDVRAAKLVFDELRRHGVGAEPNDIDFDLRDEKTLDSIIDKATRLRKLRFGR